MSPKRTNRPRINEYFGSDAEAYAKSTWMARNQLRTTDRALSHLLSNSTFSYSEAPPFNPSELMILDLGCGTGYSSEVLLDQFARVIAMDFSRDMLQYIHPSNHLNLIQADLRMLPFRDRTFSCSVSISAYNFVAEGVRNSEQMYQTIYAAIHDLFRIMVQWSRLVIEFYPTEVQQQHFMKALRSVPFQGGLLLEQPNTRKEQKFLILQKE